ncbi:MAG: hypothetical protein L6R42_006756 [Xanthoria sp. 1 TBL-2021]|nr:MAG: hypothetical protein L6R42_006756 [Xanthoria sp. 1 TBL-2021]
MLLSSQTDFFSSGVDSLKAIQMRRLIQKTLDLQGATLSPNIVYEKANARDLVLYRSALRRGEEIQQEELTPQDNMFLTGTTGSIGAHTLSQLLSNPTITKIYCPVRGSNPVQRVFASLSTRHLSVPKKHQHKIFAFSDLSQPDFGLDPSTFALLKGECALIIHIAWPVNFNLPLKGFEPYICGLHNLLSLSTCRSLRSSF